jgi:glucose-6-phosphate 1-dehydrogenase
MNTKPINAAILTIFGITGDLAHRKLLPALYFLQKEKRLPHDLRIVGVTRQGTTVETVVDSIRKHLEDDGERCDPAVLKQLAAITSIVTMDITAGADYEKLKIELDQIESSVGICLNRLFYLAIPSQVFAPVVRLLGTAKLHTGCQHHIAESRLLIEKPFGFDMASANELIEVLSHDFSEDQIYRIDHYLAKETVQNILTFRYHNPLFANSWNNQYIRQITITAAEKIGIEGRATFYEQMGALRDLIQSHLLQVLALIIMDEPAHMTSSAIHAKKLAALKAIRPPHDHEMASKTVRAQYDSYKGEVQNPASTVETFAAVNLSIDNQTWQGVPVLVQTGKSLAKKTTEICLEFQGEQPNDNNRLIIRIQPDEGITLQVNIKQPGYANVMEPVQMNFSYDQQLSARHSEAYQRVLLDALKGDKTLFATSQEVLECWRITQPILHAWENNAVPLLTYPSGSDGPDTTGLV